MKYAILSLSVLMASNVAAQKYAPLPRELTEAKTIYIQNLTGEPEPLDAAHKELRSWKRFEITEDKERADLIFSLAVSQSQDAGMVGVPVGGIVAVIPTRQGFTTLRILDPKRPEAPPIWSVTRSWGSGGTKACIKELRRRFPKKQ